MRRIYLDHSASTPLDPRVFEVMSICLQERQGNPSSVHAEGREARATLDEARASLARILRMRPGEVVFTSGGTESNNLALKGITSAMRRKGRNHILTSVAEHASVLETCAFLEGEGFHVTYLPVDGWGRVDPDDVRKALRPGTGLISVMHANNEVGCLNPVEELVRLAREAGVLFHTDAVQTFGKLDPAAGWVGADLLSISAHKMYGPKGVGALLIRGGVEMESQLHGGSQERGRRAGTENVALAVGFARAAEIAEGDRDAEMQRLGELKDWFGRRLLESHPGLLLNTHPATSLPTVLSVSFDSRKDLLDGEALLFGLDLEGVAVSSGSACTSGSLDPSHVLLAMGRDPATARATVRFSLGRSTTREDLEETVRRLENVVARVRKVQGVDTPASRSAMP